MSSRSACSRPSCWGGRREFSRRLPPGRKWWDEAPRTPLVGVMLVGAALAAVIGWVGLRRLRADYQAMIMLVVSVVATLIANSEIGLVNGPAGLSLIPRPLAGVLNLAPARYSWFFAGLCGLLCAGVGFVCWRLEDSPSGPMLRGLRQNSQPLAPLHRRARPAP